MELASNPNEWGIKNDDFFSKKGVPDKTKVCAIIYTNL